MNATEVFRRTPKGVLTNIYSHMKSRHPVSFSRKELHDRFLNDQKFNRLFKEWIDSDFNREKRPSIDRINHRGIYSMANIHVMTLSENRFKQKMEGRIRKGAVLQILGNTIVERFRSQREAVLKTGIPQGNMSSVLNGKRSKVHGFKFIYENKELLP